MASNKEQRGNNNESGSSGKKGVQDRIDEIISQDRVVIFSKSTCPYCDDAKKVFDDLGQSYSTVELTDHPKAPEVQSVLRDMTGAGTVPRVFVDGKCIGGGTDTVKLYQEGTLEQILRQPDTVEHAKSANEWGSGEKFS